MKSRLDEMLEDRDHPMPFCRMVTRKRFWLGLLDALIAIAACGIPTILILYIVSAYIVGGMHHNSPFKGLSK